MGEDCHPCVRDMREESRALIGLILCIICGHIVLLLLLLLGDGTGTAAPTRSELGTYIPLRAAPAGGGPAWVEDAGGVPPHEPR